MEILLVAAMSLNRVIGRGSAIPWHIPGEHLHFKKVTMGHPIVMGRKTFESIGRVLPGRRNIVITRNKEYRVDGCDVFFSFKQAIRACSDNEKVFVIGGEEIFRQALPLAHGIILTTIEREVEGDVFFPHFEGFEKINEERIVGKDPYRIEFYKRKKE